jgi:predicted ArsR family transcriptional regulator
MEEHMLPIERRNEILTKLTLEGKVIVGDLAQFYNVTEETIRRDLDKLEKDGDQRACTPPVHERVEHRDPPEDVSFP